MRSSIFVWVGFALILTGSASAETAAVSFCVNADTDDLCDREFTAYVELDGLTDMDLLKVAFEDELRYYNWEDYLWAVSISTYDYDLLPQFDGPEDVNIDGAQVNIWWAGWVRPESTAPGFGQTDRSPAPYSDDSAPGTTLTDSSEEGFLSDLKPGEAI